MIEHRLPPGPPPAARHRLAPLYLTILAAALLPRPGLCADPPPDGSAPVMTEQQILDALHPQAVRKRPLDHARTRSLSRMPDDAAAPADDQPAAAQSAAGQSVSLNIPFERNSSSLQPQAVAQLKILEAALNSPSVGKDRFMVAGHTDAKGGAAYNKELSLKRAQAVKRFLVSNGVDPKRLDTAGYGSEQLLAPDRPEDPSNRRVEIRDLGESP
jgi:outer membrane protein OmpA-like peptidoglycan-associated protein